MSVDWHVPHTEDFSLLQGATEEERQFQKAQTTFQELMTQPGYKGLLTTMVTLRQAHSWVATELEEMLANLPSNQTNTLLGDMFRYVASQQAADVFNIHQVMQSLLNITTTVLAEKADARSEEEEKLVLEEREANNAARLRRRIPLGFNALVTSTPEEPADTLPRGVALVLTGWEPAVLWLLSLLTKTATEAGDTVVRLSFRVTKDERSSRLFTTGASHWEGCANSKRICFAYMAGAQTNLSNPIDLMICDDMARAMTRSFSWRDRAATAGDALRIFRGVAEEGKCAFVGGLPHPEKETPVILGDEGRF